jgi:hypothetical protein
MLIVVKDFVDVGIVYDDVREVSQCLYSVGKANR